MTPLVARGRKAVYPCNEFADWAAADGRIDLAIEVKHQKIFLARHGRCRSVWIADKFEMPCGFWPSDHQQGMPAFCGGVCPEQDIQAQSTDPEPLGCPQVVTWTCDTQVAARQRLHSSIIADITTAWSAARAGLSSGAARRVWRPPR